MLINEPIIRHSYTFLNAPIPEGHSWTVDDDGSFDYLLTGGKIVTQELIDMLGDDVIGCDDFDYFATEADTMIEFLYG